MPSERFDDDRVKRELGSNVEEDPASWGLVTNETGSECVKEDLESAA